MAVNKTKMSKWPRIRKLINDVHLWMGLSSGLILIVVCFTGTVYVFSTELTERAAPHLYKVEAAPGAQPLPVDSLLAKVAAETGGKVSSVTIPEASNRTYRFAVKTTADTTPRSGTTYMVNPYTGVIVGNSKEKNGTKAFMSTMFSLHRWLLLDKVKRPIISGVENRKLGSWITGWATILFTLGCITGLVIWFPQKVKYWRQGLKIKWNAGWKRINHDLHNTLAFYALFFLLLMGLTGPQWSFDWYRTGLQKTMGTYKPNDKAKGTKQKDGSKGGPKAKQENKDTVAIAAELSIGELIKKADAELSYAGDYTVNLPAKGETSMGISKNKTGFFAPAAGDKITLNSISGKVEKKEIFSAKPFNERIAGSIKALHLGNVYGTFTKILYFIACLIATTLPITGTLIWINKMKKKPAKRMKPVATVAQEEVQI